jgi:RNA polymerase sigma-70 factor (ECF subfamily)
MLRLGVAVGTAEGGMGTAVVENPGGPSVAPTVTRADLHQTLVAQARDGSPEALAELYDRYAPTIYNLGMRLMGSGPDAEDVVHDVFVGLPQALKSYEGRGSFEGWLNRVASRVALMKLRRMKVRSEVSLAASSRVPSGDFVPSLLDQVTLRDALNQLPTHLRTTFWLKEVEGYSHAEIAELEDITVTSSKTRLFRAREMLRTLLATSL